VVTQHLSFSEEVAAYDRFDKRVEVFMKVILNPSRSAVLSSRVARSYTAPFYHARQSGRAHAWPVSKLR
jgi:hypothetical protein